MNLYLEKLSLGGNSSLLELIVLKHIVKHFHECLNWIEYHHNGNEIGHWTLKNGQEPDKKGAYENNCLFDVFASIEKIDPDILREKTIDYLSRIQNKYPEETLKKIIISTNYFKGGAKYYPSNPQEAGNLLDQCNGQQPHFKSSYAHPRGHSSNPQIPISDNNMYKSVENYSMVTSLPTGFLTTDDQNTLFHIIMQSGLAEQAMDQLNSGSTDSVFTVTWDNLNEMIKVANWKMGRRVTDLHNPRGYTILLAHQRGSVNDKDAPVFVHTFYPRLRNVPIKEEGWD